MPRKASSSSSKCAFCAACAAWRACAAFSRACTCSFSCRARSSLAETIEQRSSASEAPKLIKERESLRPLDVPCAASAAVGKSFAMFPLPIRMPSAPPIPMPIRDPSPGCRSGSAAPACGAPHTAPFARGPAAAPAPALRDVAPGAGTEMPGWAVVEDGVGVVGFLPQLDPLAPEAFEEEDEVESEMDGPEESLPVRRRGCEVEAGVGTGGVARRAAGWGKGAINPRLGRQA